MTFVLGGASGTLLKSCTPSRYIYADDLGLHLDVLVRFNVISHCCNNWSHSEIGNSGSHVANPDKK